MPTILLATANPHKVTELRAILAHAPATFLSLADLPTPTAEPEETGDTFEANATIKALSYADQTGHLCLADDSGLEVDALGGRPGVISSHYCTDGRDVGMTREQRDTANNERLLRELAGVPLERRTARFVCVMVLAMPASRLGASQGDDLGVQDPKTRASERRGTQEPATEWRGTHETPATEWRATQRPRILAITRGAFEGRIGLTGDVPRGHGGFGYDPLLLVPPDYTRTSAELSPEEKNTRSHRGAAARAMADALRNLNI